MMMAATTQRARTRDMTDEERIERHQRSMKLYGQSIACSQTATFFGILSVAYLPIVLVALTLLVAALLISAKGDRVSPYGGRS